MRVLFIQFQPDDPPARLGTGLAARGVRYEVAHVYAGDPIPPLDGYQGLIVLGGYMNAEDDAHFPYLPAVVATLQDAHNRALPTLGICLGGQLLARALGARVWRKPLTEVGYYPIRLTEAGLRDPLFQDLPAGPLAFQWHEDAFDLPEGATLLADSPRDSLQAYRKGLSYGIQFHPEVDLEVVRSWAYEGIEGLREAADPATPEELIACGAAVDDAFAAQTAQLCRNLHAIMEQEAKGRSGLKSALGGT